MTVETPVSDSVDNDVVDSEIEATEEVNAKMYRVKGEGFEEDVDEATLIKGYQLERSSSKRFEDAKKLEKSVGTYLPVIEALQKGDLGVLKKLGIKPEAIREFSEKELLSYIEEQELSPEERRARNAESEVEKLRAEKENYGKQQQDSQRHAAANRAAQEIDGDMREALKDVDIPLKGNHQLVRRIAEDMYAQIEVGKKPSAKKSLGRVLDGLNKDFSEHATRQFKKDPKSFIDGLPKNILDGIRKMSLDDVQNQMPMTNKNNQTNKPRTVSDDFRDYMKSEMRR